MAEGVDTGATDATLHVEVVGAGPDLVLIHGWAMHAGIFAPLTRHLAGQFRLHLVDLPGHGYSGAHDGALDLMECARQIVAQTPVAAWIGWSLGGLVALTAALAQPDRITGLVEIAVSPRFVIAPDWPHGVAAGMFAQFADGLRHDYRGTLERFLALEAHGSDHARAELRELKAHVFERGTPAVRVLCEGLALLEHTDLRQELARLSVPSLWIAGRRDRLIPAAAMRWAAARSRGGRYLEICAGHAPFIGHPAHVAAAIAEFARVRANQT